MRLLLSLCLIGLFACSESQNSRSIVQVGAAEQKGEKKGNPNFTLEDLQELETAGLSILAENSDGLGVPVDQADINGSQYYSFVTFKLRMRYERIFRGKVFSQDFFYFPKTDKSCRTTLQLKSIIDAAKLNGVRDDANALAKDLLEKVGFDYENDKKLWRRISTVNVNETVVQSLQAYEVIASTLEGECQNTNLAVLQDFKAATSTAVPGRIDLELNLPADVSKYNKIELRRSAGNTPPANCQSGDLINTFSPPFVHDQKIVFLDQTQLLKTVFSYRACATDTASTVISNLYAAQITSMDKYDLATRPLFFHVVMADKIHPVLLQYVALPPDLFPGYLLGFDMVPESRKLTTNARFNSRAFSALFADTLNLPNGIALCLNNLWNKTGNHTISNVRTGPNLGGINSYYEDVRKDTGGTGILGIVGFHASSGATGDLANILFDKNDQLLPAYYNFAEIKTALENAKVRTIVVDQLIAISETISDPPAIRRLNIAIALAKEGLASNFMLPIVYNDVNANQTIISTGGSENKSAIDGIHYLTETINKVFAEFGTHAYLLTSSDGGREINGGDSAQGPSLLIGPADKIQDITIAPISFAQSYQEIYGGLVYQQTVLQLSNGTEPTSQRVLAENWYSTAMKAITGNPVTDIPYLLNALK